MEAHVVIDEGLDVEHWSRHVVDLVLDSCRSFIDRTHQADQDDLKQQHPRILSKFGLVDSEIRTHLSDFDSIDQEFFIVYFCSVNLGN